MIHFSQESALSKRAKADVCLIPFYEGKKGAECACKLTTQLQAGIKSALSSGDFTGEASQTLVLYLSGQPEKRAVLVGLGKEKELTVEVLRRAYSTSAKLCHKLKIKAANALLPTSESLSTEEISRGLSEGLLLSNYAFDKLKTSKTSSQQLLQKVALIGDGKEALKSAKEALHICQGVYFARDLVNGNADDVTPEHIGDMAKEIAKKHSTVKTQVFSKSKIEKEKMGLLLAVSRGSHIDPSFVICEYKGDPKSNDTTVVVGKGVTYDTGGLNLKPTGSMETMKADMGGAATALGTLHAVASLKLPCNLTIVIPTTENSISAKSYKPGDVYKSYQGQTVEIGNTDAEGRLILADALSWASKNLKPTRIIDFATLTGAIVIALGNEAIGLMSNDEKLASDLQKAGNDSYERACQLPVYEEYRQQLNSDVADIKNIGGRAGGSITAAVFLKEFVGKGIPWAHFDIAASAYLDKAIRYNPQHGTGIGVRLMLSYLKNHVCK